MTAFPISGGPQPNGLFIRGSLRCYSGTVGSHAWGKCVNYTLYSPSHALGSSFLWMDECAGFLLRRSLQEITDVELLMNPQVLFWSLKKGKFRFRVLIMLVMKDILTAIWSCIFSCGYFFYLFFLQAITAALHLFALVTVFLYLLKTWPPLSYISNFLFPFSLSLLFLIW